jgi:hypothetical protein
VLTVRKIGFEVSEVNSIACAQTPNPAVHNPSTKNRKRAAQTPRNKTESQSIRCDSSAFRNHEFQKQRSRAPMRIAHIEGVPIPNDWPEIRRNSKVRTPAAVEVARSLIAPGKASAPRSSGRISAQKNLENNPTPRLSRSPKSAQASYDNSLAVAAGTAQENFSDLRVTLQNRPSFRTTTQCDVENGPLAEIGVVMKKTKKTPDAIEAARALVKFKSNSSAIKAPIVFERCDDDPGDVAPLKRRGRARTQPPADLRDEMPEHSDEAYFEAQAQLRQRSTEQGAPGSNGTVPASDYHRGGPRLSPDEIEKIIDLYTNEYGAILRLDQAAEITKLSKQTLRRKVCEGKFSSSVFRGTPLRFITRRLVEEVLG